MLITLNDALILATNYAISGVENELGGPFGAVILKRDSSSYDLYEVIALGRNTVISSLDPTNHAEMNAIREACKKLKTFDLTGYILVTTGESCPMCKSATMWANITEVYYGTTYYDAELIGFRDKHIDEHLKGKVKLLNEKQLNREYALKCHQHWINKENKTLY